MNYLSEIIYLCIRKSYKAGSMHTRLTQFIDFFYLPFRKVMPITLFRYIFCGGSNVLFDWVLYFVFYNFVFQKTILNLGFIAFAPHIAALVFSFPITLLSGFYLSRNITFQDSNLHSRIQLFRYLVIVGVNLLINYVCLKCFVDYLHIFPTPSKMMTTVFTTIFSYFAQKHYSFRKIKTNEVEDTFTP